MWRSRLLRRIQGAALALVMGIAVPQFTCTVPGPPGGTFVLDPDSAFIVADLIRDIVFFTQVDDDFFDDFDDHHHHDHLFFWW